MNRTALIIGILLIYFFVVQGIGLYLQVRRMNQVLRRCRKLGRTSVGVGGSVWGKVYGVLVADEQGVVADAQQLSGLSVFAHPKPVSGLIGLTVDKVASGPVTSLSPKARQAFVMAAEALLNKEESGGEAGADAVG